MPFLNIHLAWEFFLFHKLAIWHHMWHQRAWAFKGHCLKGDVSHVSPGQRPIIDQTKTLSRQWSQRSFHSSIHSSLVAALSLSGSWWICSLSREHREWGRNASWMACQSIRHFDIHTLNPTAINKNNQLVDRTILTQLLHTCKTSFLFWIRRGYALCDNMLVY